MDMKSWHVVQKSAKKSYHTEHHESVVQRLHAHVWKLIVDGVHVHCESIEDATQRGGVEENHWRAQDGTEHEIVDAGGCAQCECLIHQFTYRTEY